MKKADVFRLVFKGIETAITALNPPVGFAVQGIESGVEKLIHRDADPTNDLDETAEALTQIVMNVVVGAEALTQKDYLHDPILKQLASNITGDIKLALLLKVQPA